jgi:hypothetical protein
MTVFTNAQWASAKSIIDILARENSFSEKGFSSEQWGTVRDIVDGRRSIQNVKDDSKVYFSSAQWTVVKDMVEGKAEALNDMRKESKVCTGCFMQS